MKIFIIIILIAAILVGGYFLIVKGYNKPSSNPSPNPTSNAVTTDKVTIKNFAFDPQVITVKSGTTVTWTNEDSVPHEVASDPHPTHTDLPGLVSDPFSQGQTYSFTFTQVGTFGYHCHIHPTMTGKVIVTE